MKNNLATAKQASISPLRMTLFILTALWGALIPWMANHPPMLDLPQHAAQIGLWRDLLQGTSAWEDFFRINLLTPYLLGYGIALPLSFLIGITASLKLMLSVAYLAFVYLCVRLRQQFGGDARLDWLFLLGFFGYAYKWGFFTFLVAAPIGLLFTLYAEEYAKGFSLRQTFKLLLTGVLLLASHGLVFLYAVGCGFAMHLLRNYRLRGVVSRSWPFVVLIAVCGLYFLVNQKFSADMPTNLTTDIKWDYNLARIAKAIVYPVAPFSTLSAMLIPVAVMLIMLVVPLLMGLKINWRNPAALVPLGLTVFILGFIPNYAFSTGLLYQRFALFLLPAYAWIFIATRQDSASTKPDWRKWLVVMLIAATWAMLSLHTVRTWRFGQETAEIDNIMTELEPRQRALIMVFDPNSPADGQFKVYTHYPAWYQAEKGGLVDFNFAWFPPQVVRYRADRLPAVEPGFEWNVDDFSWQTHRGDDYRYFFIRHSEPLPAGLFHGARCAPTLILQKGLWSIYERQACR